MAKAVGLTTQPFQIWAELNCSSGPKNLFTLDEGEPSHDGSGGIVEFNDLTIRGMIPHQHTAGFCEV